MIQNIISGNYVSLKTLNKMSVIQHEGITKWGIGGGNMGFAAKEQ